MDAEQLETELRKQATRESIEKDKAEVRWAMQHDDSPYYGDAYPEPKAHDGSFEFIIFVCVFVACVFGF